MPIGINGVVFTTHCYPPFVIFLWLHETSKDALSSHLVTAQHFARQRPGTLLPLKGDDAIYNGEVITIRLLYASPVIIRKIIDCLHWQHLQFLQIIDDDICRHTFTEPAAITDADRPAQH